MAAEVDGPRVITESRTGSQLQEEDTRALLHDLLIYGSEQTREELPVMVTEPNISTEEAQNTLGRGEVVGECTTSIEAVSYTHLVSCAQTAARPAASPRALCMASSESS